MVYMMETVYDRDAKYLGKLADVFGDPTRRSIYRSLRQADQPLTASEVAETFGLHRTVARAHLEKLGQLGLVETGTRRRRSGGRPAKTYVLSDERLEIVLPPRRYERLSRQLLRLIDAALPPEEAAAEALAIGLTFGQETAAALAGDRVEPPIRLSPQAVASWLDANGNSATVVENGGGKVVFEVHNCVYRELADEFPDIVCPFDRGTLCGLLGVSPDAHTRTLALSAGDDFCRHEFVS